MKSVLEEFARSMLSNGEGYISKDSLNNCNTYDLGDIEDKLMASLEGELKNTFRQFVLAQAQAELKSGIGGFITGYRLGVLMTIEVLYANDGQA